MVCSGIRQPFSDVPSQYRVKKNRGSCSRRRLQCLDTDFWARWLSSVWSFGSYALCKSGGIR
jgi:hypothetical protein